MDVSARRVAVLLSFAALSSLALPALAVDPLDTFSARIGGYTNSFETEIRADGETSEGTDVDLERDLDLDPDSVIGFAALTWRPFEHHEFGLAYYGSDTSKTNVLTRDIVFEDTVYEATSTVKTDLNVDAYELSYVWWAASRENWALGPRLGLVWYSIDLDIDLQVDSDGNQVNGAISDHVSTDLPAPTIGGSWRWTPADDWRVSADAGFLSANVSSVDADVTFGRLGVEWFP
ncbi:hypothetical protein [Agrilutibacter solisilvae]|uniref:Outer membrane protein beta-barrel domain-containing protein n=1 Tax=Agrilutibacter solisilvae TaxID=2763317 RepID=A0A974XWD7_9GAMM|nr:hypothetical protein [Lysobacter solisilvae]QSX77111.1 hypothetical protein I8J32_009855 [Lysobacter solisilvae]